MRCWLVEEVTDEGRMAWTERPDPVPGEGELLVKVEAAGTISLETVRAYADAGVDFVTVGALTHSVIATDLTMRISPDAS